MARNHPKPLVRALEKRLVKKAGQIPLRIRSTPHNLVVQSKAVAYAHLEGKSLSRVLEEFLIEYVARRQKDRKAAALVEMDADL